MRKNNFFRLFNFMKGMFAKYIVGILGVSLTSALTQVIMAYFFKNIFSASIVKNQEFMLANFIHFGIIIVIFHLILPFFAYMVDVVAAKTTGNLRKTVFHHSKNLPMNFFKDKHSGDLLSRLTNDISEAEKAYSQTFIQFVTQAVTGVFTLAYIFYLEWHLALLTVLGGIITLIINVYFSKKLKNASSRVQIFLAMLTEKLSNILVGVDIIRSFNLQNLYTKKFHIDNQQVYDASYERVNIEAIVSMLNALVATTGFVGIVAVGTYLTIQGYIETGIIIAALQLQAGPIQLIRALGNFIPQLQSSLAAADRLFEIIDEEQEPQVYQETKGYKKQNIMVGFKNVSFAYQDDLILNNLSFEISKGKVVALVGPSGSGKSTIFKLILNFYPCTRGDIIIDETFISDQTIREIRQKIAYVPQDAYLFNGTVAENISHGKEEAVTEDIVEAAKAANAHNFIMELKNGYDTVVGERGTHLSGGQRQRIAIARAVIKNAPILLLDEATSALDNESEYFVQEALSKLMLGRTTLVIAHRLSTIREADQIFVLKNGIITEKGTHQELMGKKEGVYYRLYSEQFREDNADAVS